MKKPMEIIFENKKYGDTVYTEDDLNRSKYDIFKEIYEKSGINKDYVKTNYSSEIFENEEFKILPLSLLHQFITDSNCIKNRAMITFSPATLLRETSSMKCLLTYSVLITMSAMTA
jgi:hypothetical protein